MDGRGSSDPDGTIAAYQWSVNGQVVGTATTATPTLNLADGSSTVSLVVTDNQGAKSAPASVTITVQGANKLPVVTIEVGSQQIPDSDGKAGELVPFKGTASDADGTVSTDTFRWSVNGKAVADANGKLAPVLPLDNGDNTVTLSATDNGGGVGSSSIRVTVGEADALVDLPGVEGNENLTNTAVATQSTCSELLKLPESVLDAGQREMRKSCETLAANVQEDPNQAADALKQLSGEQVTALQTTATDFAAAQVVNLGARLVALRQGAKGFSVSGLNLSLPGPGAPLQALASLGQVLLGEGGSSGDEEQGGLLDDRLGIFINGAVRFGSQDASSRESGFDFDTQGITIGADYRFNEALVAGLALGYGNAQADFDSNGGSQDSDSFSGSLYGSWYRDRGYLDGIVSVGSISYDTMRNIDLFDGAVVDKFKGNTDGTQWAIGVAGGYDFGAGALTFGPNLAVDYYQVNIDAFTEKAEMTSGLAERFGDQSADSLTAKLGGHLAYSLSGKWGVFSPQARFDFVREFMNDSQTVKVSYANDPIVTGPGSGGTFLILTDNPDEYYFVWAVGVSAQFLGGFAGFIDYESVAGMDRITSGEVSFGLRYQSQFR
jgi:uncharacterized protein YhjY with autotransporter beta-barrel domain